MSASQSEAVFINASTMASNISIQVLDCTNCPNIGELAPEISAILRKGKGIPAINWLDFKWS